MAFETGTAAGHKDMLDILRQKLKSATFMGAGSEWEELRWDISTDNHELAMRGVGFGAGLGQPIIHIQTVQGLTPTYNNWKLDSADFWDPGSSFGNQPGSLAASGIVPRIFVMPDSSFTYWLYANGHRVILAVDASGSDSMCYLGLASPPGVPEDYPYPMVVAGNTNTESDTTHDTGLFNFFCGDISCTRFKSPGGSWRTVENVSGSGSTFGNHLEATHDAETGSNKDFSTGSYTFVWPYNMLEDFYVTWGNYIPTCHDGSYPMFPATVVNRNSEVPRGTWGHLTGVYWVPKTGGLLEHDTVTGPGGKTLRIFGNQTRAGYYDCCGIVEE